MRCCHVRCIFMSTGYSRSRIADIFKTAVYTDPRNIFFAYSLKYITMLNFFQPVFLRRGDLGSLPASQMEFFATIVTI